jgi:hypothetical protein
MLSSWWPHLEFHHRISVSNCSFWMVVYIGRRVDYCGAWYNGNIKRRDSFLNWGTKSLQALCYYVFLWIYFSKVVLFVVMVWYMHSRFLISSFSLMCSFYGKLSESDRLYVYVIITFFCPTEKMGEKIDPRGYLYSTWRIGRVRVTLLN